MPFFVLSKHVGAAQSPSTQLPLAQSAPAMHWSPSAQGGAAHLVPAGLPLVPEVPLVPVGPPPPSPVPPELPSAQTSSEDEQATHQAKEKTENQSRFMNTPRYRRVDHGRTSEN